MFCKIENWPAFIIILLFFSSCANLRNAPRYQLRDGYYKLVEHGDKQKKVFIQTSEDSAVIYQDNKAIKKPLSDDAKLIKESFDVDVIAILFKYRPATQNLPRQLTTDFNGNLYLGYRVDRFIKHTEQTPVGPHKSVKHRAFTIGLFGGIGSTNITPWTTNNKTTDEYNALVLSNGVAMMAGVNNLTVGFGVGWDRVTDRDKDIWIYQNKPWYGLSFGLSIN